MNLKILNYCFLALSIFVARSLTSDKLLSYYALIVFIFLWGICLLQKPILIKFKIKSLHDYLPAASILTWLYGLLLGLTGGYPIESVVSNFAAMVFYIFYYILVFARHKSYDLLNWMILLSCGYLVYFVAPLLVRFDLVNIKDFDEIGLTAIRMGWSSSLSLALLLIGIGFSRLIKLSNLKDVNISRVPHHLKMVQPGKVVSIGYVLLGTVSILLAGSKGFVFALFFLVSFLVINQAFSSLRRLWFAPEYLFFLFCCFLFILLRYEDIIYFFSKLYDIEMMPEHPRNIQKLELFNDFNILGRGLGSGLSSGYSRDDLSYGFELSFHNIFHKFGIFSIFPFATIFWPFFAGALNIMRGRNFIVNLSAFSLMLYIIPGYGNPIIFSPINVVLNCVALYLVANRFR